MNRARVIVAIAVSALLLGGAFSYAANSLLQSRAARVNTHTAAADAPALALGHSPRIVFRNTAIGSDYGRIASVAVGTPESRRTFSAISCDRIYATSEYSMCLRTDSGALTTFSASLLNQRGTTLRSWPLPGIPSRTRISADSHLVAFTAFVTGAAYASVGFATQTIIARTNGPSYGNLEGFTLMIDGKISTAIDRNFWGVTFATDDNTFFATAATAGETWLVRGDLALRTLTAIHGTAECPSLSPDGTRIAYKKNISHSATAFWSLAILDLASGRETVLPEKRSVDDQAEWLDNTTVLYGIPRQSTPGDSDIWSIKADGSNQPQRLIQHASSPSVVRS